MAVKKCAFCGKEYETTDKSVILFKAKESGTSVRICSHCIEKCNELYQNKLAQDKIKAIEAAPAILTPKEIDEDIEHLSTLIATSINQYIQDDFTSM